MSETILASELLLTWNRGEKPQMVAENQSTHPPIPAIGDLPGGEDELVLTSDSSIVEDVECRDM